MSEEPELSDEDSDAQEEVSQEAAEGEADEPTDAGEQAEAPAQARVSDSRSIASAATTSTPAGGSKVKSPGDTSSELTRSRKR